MNLRAIGLAGGRQAGAEDEDTEPSLAEVGARCLRGEADDWALEGWGRGCR